MIFDGKAATQTTPPDIEALLRNSVEEDAFLNYKARPHPVRRSSRRRGARERGLRLHGAPSRTVRGARVKAQSGAASGRGRRALRRTRRRIVGRRRPRGRSVRCVPIERDRIAADGSPRSEMRIEGDGGASVVLFHRAPSLGAAGRRGYAGSAPFAHKFRCVCALPP